MNGDDARSGPTAHNRIGHRVHVVPDQLTLSDRQLIGSVSRQNILRVVVAAGVGGMRVVEVLVVRIAWRSLGGPSPGAVLSAVVGEAMRPGIGNLSLQSIRDTLLQNGLHRVVRHVAFGRCAGY